MSDINGVVLNAGSLPTVVYTITYTKTRPNNNQMTYDFTISAALATPASFIRNGYALLCTMTVAGVSSQVRIKEVEGDNWEGTTPRIRHVSVTCPSTVGNATQTVRFKVISDGWASMDSGVIDTSEYTVLSAPLLTTACGAPTVCSVNNTVAEGNVTLSWSGATGGTNNSITGYEIQYSDSTNNTTWGNWIDLAIVNSNLASGSLSVSPPTIRGHYRRFRVRTLGAAGSDYYSDWKITTNSVRKNIPPQMATTVTASPLEYSTEPVFITWSGASGGTSPIKGYMVASRTSTDGTTWTGWEILEIFDHPSSSGSRQVEATDIPGIYTMYGLWTIDALNVYSSEQVSNSILCVSVASSAPKVAVPKEGTSIYNLSPRFLITTGPQPEEQVIAVKIDSGEWLDTINNPEYFSKEGLLENDTTVIFQADEQTPGTKVVTIRALNKFFDGPSIDVVRNFTILPSTFETITANETKVKARHVSDLRVAVNTIRSYYGLPPVSWNETIIPGKTYIKNWPLHIIEIRNSIEPIIDLINQFEAGTITEVDWIDIGTGRPRASVMEQLYNLIMNL